MFVQRNREQKKADAAGTRAPVKRNGLPVKAPKPTSIVSINLCVNLLLDAHGR
jgi:hypothetical protein